MNYDADLNINLGSLTKVIQHLQNRGVEQLLPDLHTRLKSTLVMAYATAWRFIDMQAIAPMSMHSAV